MLARERRVASMGGRFSMFGAHVSVCPVRGLGGFQWGLLIMTVLRRILASMGRNK